MFTNEKSSMESMGSKHFGTHQRGIEVQLEVGIPYVCQSVKQIISKGHWFGDNPLTFSFPLLLLQLSIVSILTHLLSVIFKRCAQPFFVSQILSGIILGPSVLGRISTFATMFFPFMGINVLETSAFFGLMLFIFQIGVKIDPTIILKSGKRPLAIGVLSLVIPYVLARFTALFLKHFLSLDKEVSSVLPHVVMVHSMTSFPVVACFLAEFEILNSEIGRLACSSSIVCDLCYWSVVYVKYAITLAMEMSLQASICAFLSDALLISVIVFGIRSGALWVVQNSPEGEPVKEIYILAVFVALLICGFLGEVIGLNAFATSFILGLVIPDGPPLGAALSDRLDCFVTVFLMPIFFMICGLRMNVFSIQKLLNVGVIQLIVFVALLGKIVGAILPPLLCRTPFRDALALGFIMNCKGTIHLALLVTWKIQNVMNEECFTIMIISVVLETGFLSPLIKVLYDPSRKFLAYKRRTILHHRHDEELRVLTCVHRLEDALAIRDLLLASNPNHESPIDLVVLHLIKLAGRSSSLLVLHQPHEMSYTYKTQSEQVFNIFRKLEAHFNGCMIINCFKGISPYSTMYNDVCSLALDKRTTFIVIPFHRQQTAVQGLKSSHAIRQMNQNVLDKAPCTVGILIDNGKRRISNNLSQPVFHRVAVLFFGGADDREALAYAKRMSEHGVTLTLFHFTSSKDTVSSSARSKMLDSNILNDFRIKYSQNNQVSYEEKVMTDGDAVITALKSLENAYDLVMVGRRHAESWLMSVLHKWNSPEEDLGVVGNILVSPNHGISGVSILVMQQQTKLWGLRDPEESTRLRRVKL